MPDSAGGDRHGARLRVRVLERDVRARRHAARYVDRRPQQGRSRRCLADEGFRRRRSIWDYAAGEHAGGNPQAPCGDIKKWGGRDREGQEFRGADPACKAVRKWTNPGSSDPGFVFSGETNPVRMGHGSLLVRRHRYLLRAHEPGLLGRADQRDHQFCIFRRRGRRLCPLARAPGVATGRCSL